MLHQPAQVLPKQLEVGTELAQHAEGVGMEGLLATRHQGFLMRGKRCAEGRDRILPRTARQVLAQQRQRGAHQHRPFERGEAAAHHLGVREQQVHVVRQRGQAAEQPGVVLAAGHVIALVVVITHGLRLGHHHIDADGGLGMFAAVRCGPVVRQVKAVHLEQHHVATAGLPGDAVFHRLI